MQICDLINENRILLSVKPASKCDLLRRIARELNARKEIGDPEAVTQALMERERLCTTAVGGGYAIPHTFTPEAPQMMIALASVPEGADFKALDGKPIRFLFIILGPPEAQKYHLNLLGRLSRMLNDHSFIKQMMAAKEDKLTLLAALQAQEREYEERFQC
ncbi:MAG: PTS sugar transporter subunit IIA [Candidatus Sumerlaeota bacterium]|nr:PTS sugar transporter subunit IIA [Candidatus Sumerlaeota bacterium]